MRSVADKDLFSNNDNKRANARSLFMWRAFARPPSAPSPQVSLTTGGLEATPSQCTVASYPPAFVIWGFASFHNHYL